MSALCVYLRDFSSSSLGKRSPDAECQISVLRRHVDQDVGAAGVGNPTQTISLALLDRIKVHSEKILVFT